ncbi:Major facilitator superfamily MFS-1 [Mycena venus]|uniref:Major facilitator superfamily MFS-1 n=1 Tax=Mycena venus TaxID=2733690 RepID=A0A8H7CIL2_9AGAR|nr:Major facilitator superfamily MFS-1 [Mycena venus]
MALLLAPYNDAMRLGMGFNSFPQQLCVNDAVRLAGGKQDIPTDKSLRPQYQPGLMTAPDGSNLDISQNVTWTAKFVDKMSEVTDSLNVSGSLQIKLDAIGGGGKATASFLDSNKFKESDINYFIQVRVTNQHLTAPDLTEFTPIPNVPSSEFNRVYGDSFISGFIEGGEFNALISIKLNDSSQAKQIKGSLEVDMHFSAVGVSGEGQLDKQDTSSKVDGETTIAVIKDATVTDWTLETLKRVAMEFPEHVMACPMRTHAILTKYTSLKSFYEQSIKGSPLDYENAGVYSSALLDAYMDYKVMWRNIQQAAWEVENGQSMLTMKEALPELAELETEAKAYYD